MEFNLGAFDARANECEALRRALRYAAVTSDADPARGLYALYELGIEDLDVCREAISRDIGAVVAVREQHCADVMTYADMRIRCVFPLWNPRDERDAHNE